MNPFEQAAESVEAGIEHLLVQRDTETTAAVTGLDHAVDHTAQVAIMTAKTALNAQTISLETTENIGQHDDLGIHPERREAEIDDLNRRFNAPPTLAQSDELATKEQSVEESLRAVYAIHEQTESSREQVKQG